MHYTNLRFTYLLQLFSECKNSTEVGIVHYRIRRILCDNPSLLWTLTTLYMLHATVIFLQFYVPLRGSSCGQIWPAVIF